MAIDWFVSIKTRPDFATLADSKISGFARPHGSKLFADSKISTLESGLKSCGFACEFAGYVWTEGESGKKKLRIQKYPDTCGRGLKAHANGRNKCQQLPTFMGVVGQQCCVRLHGPKKFDRFQTIRNKCQQVLTLLWFHANGRNKSQYCWAQQCWVLLANNVGSVCMGLYKESKSRYCPTSFPGSFLSRKKDPGWVRSRATQILGDNKYGNK